MPELLKISGMYVYFRSVFFSREQLNIAQMSDREQYKWVLLAVIASL